MNQDIEKLLNSLVKKYETPDFIKDDPVQFPHMFNDKQDIEVAGLIASSLAYGKRTKILESVRRILEFMDFKPYKFVRHFNLEKNGAIFSDFIHRYTSGKDVALLVYIIGQALNDYSSLEEIFMENFKPDDKNIKNGLTGFVETLRSYIPPDELYLRGLYHLIPDPKAGSACKRLNLFLEWMVRPGPVDLNLWKNIPTDKLIIPLDTHVAKISRLLHLTERKTDDWKTAEEITENLKQFDPDDPVKYDFALFGAGISGNKIVFG